jgi:riboflavin synthase
MFTGLVEDVGTALRVDRTGDAVVLEIRPERIAIAELADGESVCHDGVCLTVTGRGPHSYTVLAGAETLARTTLGRVTVGNRLNLERALRAGDRLGGHMVAGHVDGVATIADRADNGANLVLTIATPPALLRYIVEKGSIAVDGVSLTVNTVTADAFGVAIIPHTRDHTTLGTHPVGHPVNLEVDVIAKYVEKLVVGYRGGTP